MIDNDNESKINIKNKDLEYIILNKNGDVERYTRCKANDIDKIITFKRIALNDEYMNE